MNATVLEVAKNASRAAETTDTASKKAQEGAGIVDRWCARSATSSREHSSQKRHGELGSQARASGRS
jgi:methyl-accepting chemotaxis protein